MQTILKDTVVVQILLKSQQMYPEVNCLFAKINSVILQKFIIELQF